MKELIRKILKEQMEEDIYKKISPTDKIHMSHEDKLKFRNISPQDQPDLWKPKGLWYSIGTEWIEWISVEMPQWEDEYIYKIKTNDSEILTIGQENEKRFLEKYGLNELFKVDWSKVAQEWSGIEVLVDPRSLDNMSLWSSWDVASGCIWNIKGINGIEKL